MADFFNQAIGAPQIVAAGAATLTTFNLDNALDQAEYVFQVPEDCVITRLGYLQSSVAGTPPAYTISLRGVGLGSGNPDTVLGTPEASGSFIPTAGSGWRWITLPNSYAASGGELLCITIQHASGTIDGSNLMTLAMTYSWGTSYVFPYFIANNAGSRTKQAKSIHGFSSATKSYGFPLDAIQQVQYSSNSDPDEYAITFNLDSRWVSTYKILGARIMMRNPAATKTIDVKIYDGNTPGGTGVIASYVFDSDVVSTVASDRILEFYFDKNNIPLLSAGVTYRLGLKALQTTTNIGLSVFSFATSGDAAATPGGNNFYLSTRADGNLWTDSLNKKVHAELIVCEWTIPSANTVIPIVLE